MFMSLENCSYFAVIDTETNFDDEVISIGIVIADSCSFMPEDRLYLIIEPECRKPAVFSSVLQHRRAPVDAVVTRETALEMVRDFLSSYDVDNLFAYNARFDKSHLPELAFYNWYDIMRLAAYKQYNRSIPDTCELCKTGKMKYGYGAEEIYKMLSSDRYYSEIHNALTDAEDELDIMRLLGCGLETFEISEI